MHRLAVRRLSVNAFPKRPGANFIPLTPLAFIDRARHVFADGPAVIDSVEINQCVGCTARSSRWRGGRRDDSARTRRKILISTGSNFLCDATAGEQVKMTGPTGKVMLMPEEKADTDYIMVATGTGIAPYRGFIRRLFTETTPAGEAYKGLAWLFLGVANSDALLYDEEWQAAEWKSTSASGATIQRTRRKILISTQAGGQVEIPGQLPRRLRALARGEEQEGRQNVHPGQGPLRRRKSLRFDLRRGTRRRRGARRSTRGARRDIRAHRSRSTPTRSLSASRTAPSCTSAASRA